jgi:hypothetical protein
MYTIKARIEGKTSFLMHNERLANPRNPHTIALKELSSQRKKTPEIHDAMARTEWEGGLYEVDGRPVLPADMLLACVREGAKKRKLGKASVAGLMVDQSEFPLQFNEPPTYKAAGSQAERIQALWDAEEFFDYRGVGVQQAKVMRSRPIFHDWAVDVEIIGDPEVIASSEAVTALRTAGAVAGIGDKRPQQGRFSVVNVEVIENG